MLERILEPEIMDSDEEADEYNRMDHSAVNRAFVEDFLLAAAWAGVDLVSAAVLDLGCGTALIPLEMCRRSAGLRIVAVDAAQSMLSLARDNVGRAGFGDRIQWTRADAKRLPFGDERFDAVISNSIVHHFAEPTLAMRESLRVLAPGGLLFFRDLLRPADEPSLTRLVDRYANEATPRQRKLFADSLRAALTLDEVRHRLRQLGFGEGTARVSSDRHWTWIAIKGELAPGR